MEKLDNVEQIVFRVGSTFVSKWPKLRLPKHSENLGLDIFTKGACHESRIYAVVSKSFLEVSVALEREIQVVKQPEQQGQIKPQSSRMLACSDGVIRSSHTLLLFMHRIRAHSGVTRPRPQSSSSSASRQHVIKQEQSSRSKSAALQSFTPVRMRMAKSSALVGVHAPYSGSFSLGQSSSGQLAMAFG